MLNQYRFRLRDGNLLTTFEKTPSMASYTVAWMVSEMAASGEEDSNFRSYSRPSAVAALSVSQSQGPLLLKAMENYTGIPYALDKLDQVAVPDFFFGAMENWGLITYR
jgi:aminopeptidase N